MHPDISQHFICKKLAAVDSSQEFVETVWGVGYKLG